MSKSSKKSFVIIAIIVGAVGIGLGVYTITTVGSTLNQPAAPSSVPSLGSSTGKSESTTAEEGLHPLALNGSPLLGSPDAPITIVEYGDYQCPNCGRFVVLTKPMIIKNYINTGKANLVFKDITIYGSDSVTGALAARCSSEQGKFWDMHDLIYKNQRQINSGWLSSDTVREFASEIGLDMQEFNACFDEKRYVQKIKENFDEARSVGVEATPTFIVIHSSGETAIIKGAQPFSSFEKVLDSMLEE